MFKGGGSYSPEAALLFPRVTAIGWAADCTDAPVLSVVAFFCPLLDIFVVSVI